MQGTLATSDIVRGYRLGLLDSDSQTAGTHDVELTATSQLTGHRLRDASLR